MLTRQRAILGVTGAILLLIIASAINSYRHTVEETTADFSRFQLALVRTAATSIHARLEEKASDLRQLMNLPVVQYLEEPYLTDRLVQLVGESPYTLVREAFRVDAAGREVSRVRESGAVRVRGRLWDEKEMFAWARDPAHRGAVRFGDVNFSPGGGRSFS